MHGVLWSRGTFALAGMFAAGAAQAAPLPGCTSHIEVSGIEIVRVENNGVLVLHDGRAVDLEGILLPRGRRDRAPASAQRHAIDALRSLADGRDATLAAERPKEDRYGRLRAQVFFPEAHDDFWLQVAMLERGWARVNIAPDRRECAKELLAAEQDARRQHLGLWAIPAYAVRATDQLAHDTGTFQVVEGIVKNAEVHNGRAYLNFGDDWKTDFTVTISPDDMALFRKLKVDPRHYAGMRVRVRGWVQSLNGPEIEIADPEAIEVLGPASMQADIKRPG